jgi:quinol monooxygenase YgiN
MTFNASGAEAAEPLADLLAKYVVISRMHTGCRNIDLCVSVMSSGRFVVIEKWESAAAQRAHFDSTEMVDMAKACRPLLAGPPDVELLDGISAHDLA